MAGIYVHLPFCQSRCIYCGFYSSTALTLRATYVDCLIREYHLRRSYLGDETVRTLYLGGGTPSIVTTNDLDRLISTIVADHPCLEEITIECNPDDVNAPFVEWLKDSPVNRISIGIQSFNDDLLRWMRRRHTATEAITAVQRIQSAGISNVSIDLIFGFRSQSLRDLDEDITAALSLNPTHLSAYCLTFEEDTPLYNMLERGDAEELDEETQREMYYHLVDRLTAAGYDHYEISNFARPGCESKHNSSYWHDTPYMGLGAAAHSYNRTSRQWNVDDINSYIHAIQHDVIPCECEQIDDITHYNDLVVTALRTAQGIDLTQTIPHKEHLLQASRDLISRGMMMIDSHHHLRLTREALILADAVITELII